ncbi:bifunctional 23S rRNA (guanine(2069)-N(7))-methyltransferase RlmK/23S rRNA (guanine(2445)-N(2))-methyltransferase RlmL [Thermodesulfobacteriota bacterium]
MIRKLLNLIITCAAGLEGLVEEEAAVCGAKHVSRGSGQGQVHCSASLQAAYRMCLWSRFATRVLLVVAEFQAPDTDALYGGALQVDWNQHMGVNGTFAVDCTKHNSPIEHSRYAALRVKDAVVDQFRERYYRRPSIDTARPDIRLHMLLDRECGTLCVDLAGESLHRRGYRLAGGEAPLKESLAASVVRLAGLLETVTADAVLLDPMCGTGTLLIEAAMMLADCAPGLGRGYYGFEKWRGHNQAIWQDLVDEARKRKREGLKREWPRIIGYDASRNAIVSAVENISQAGLSGIVHVERKDLAAFVNPLAKSGQHESRSGLVVLNPPYGERLGTDDVVKYLYRCIGRKLREHCPGWRAAVLTGKKNLTGEFALNITARHHLYNGPIPCVLCVADVPVCEAAAAQPVLRLAAAEDVPGPADFVNRLRKNLKRLSKWALSEQVTCYRIYDADIPEYNIAVDIYGESVHVQEYAAPKNIDAAKAAERLQLALQAIQQLLGVARSSIFVKVRQKQKGTAQYGKQDRRGRLLEVQESNCRLLVNLSDYLDTGLFLDHRLTRSMIQQHSAGKRFLNLYGYTGSATVYAAAGGASATTTIDASANYLDWSRNNMALNGFAGDWHRMVRADCMEWLGSAREQFDLIFVDPPTFSNAKHKHRVFDVQSDYVALIKLAMRRLEPGGLLIFSTNFRKFKLENDALADYRLENISAQTIPHDFARRPKVHQCWLVRR